SLIYVVTSVMFFGSALVEKVQAADMPINTHIGKGETIIEQLAGEQQEKVNPLEEIPGTFPNFAACIKQDYEIKCHKLLRDVDEKLSDRKLLHCKEELNKLRNLIIKHEDYVEELVAVLSNPDSSVKSQTRAYIDYAVNDLNILRLVQDTNLSDNVVLYIKIILESLEEFCKEARDPSKTPGTLKEEAVIEDAELSVNEQNPVFEVKRVDTEEIKS
ncbi:hypothetical protein OCOL_000469, partial [Ordospora colligata]